LFDLVQFGDLARYLLLAGRDSVNAARHLLLAAGDTGGDPVDVARYLLLTGGDPLDALPHRFEIERYCVELLLIGRRSGWTASALASGAFGAFGAGFGANQPSCGYELAIISLAESP
jgi:hypothetical protein